MAELPSGAITFLFTDIEGSTRLLKQLRERYADVLAAHQRLLRDAFEAHRGHEVDTQGDSFFVAFTSARDGLLAAVEAQFALLSHPWPEGVQVKVRMGLHTGQAAAAGGRYTGLAVHRAARIGAAGHGGQILVSQATQALLEDEEEEELHVSFRDLGEQRLKDLDRPVRLYQATADGLPASFPSLRHEAELAQAAAAAVAVPLWRRPVVFASAALALVAVMSAAAFFASGNSADGLGGVQANHVGLIDPATNEIFAEVPVGLRPGPIALGAGSAWVGNLQDRNVTKIDVESRTGAGTISLENRTPTGIAFGAGAVWVVHAARGELSRVDPQFGQITNTIKVAGEGFGTQSGAVTVGTDAVWAVYADSTVARIDPTDLQMVRTTYSGGSAPAGVVVGSGSVWVANSGDATVVLFNPSTFEEGSLKSLSVGRRPIGIAFGEGATWVANAGDDAVTRIDPSTYATTAIIPVGDEPVAIAVGAGAVWVASTGAGTVSRIDPDANEVVDTIEVGNAPSGIAVGGGTVWVAVQAP
jgi:YVTN family beta-propeller protein